MKAFYGSELSALPPPSLRTGLLSKIIMLNSLWVSYTFFTHVLFFVGVQLQLDYVALVYIYKVKAFVIVKARLIVTMFFHSNLSSICNLGYFCLI